MPKPSIVRWIDEDDVIEAIKRAIGSSYFDDIEPVLAAAKEDGLPEEDGKYDQVWLRNWLGTPVKKRRGGRGTKYDYEGLLIYLAASCFNDPKVSALPREELYKLAYNWFEGRDSEGGTPDRRDVRDRVNAFCDEVFGPS